MVKIYVQDYGVIEVELDRKNAPNTVNNFLSLASKGFYDHLTFHRVIASFMIQGGDPLGNGTGGPSYHIKGEFKKNGFNNTLSHTRGTISMARSQNYNSAGSQFFIMHKDALYLDGEYAAFGKVIKGLEIVDKIALSKTDIYDRPIKPIYIDHMEVVDEEILPVEKI